MQSFSEETLRSIQDHPRFQWRDGMQIAILVRDHPCAEVESTRMHTTAKCTGTELDLSEYKWMNCKHDPLLVLDPAALGWLMAFVHAEDPTAHVSYLEDTEDGIPWCAQGFGMVEFATGYEEALVKLFLLLPRKTV